MFVYAHMRITLADKQTLNGLQSVDRDQSNGSSAVLIQHEWSCSATGEHDVVMQIKWVMLPVGLFHFLLPLLCFSFIHSLPVSFPEDYLKRFSQCIKLNSHVTNCRVKEQVDCIHKNRRLCFRMEAGGWREWVDDVTSE